MKDTRLIMGMPVSVEIADRSAPPAEMEEVFAWFTHVDEVFSTYKPESEMSRINSGKVGFADASSEMREILRLAEETKALTGGYFDIRSANGLDPSGIVKGWAIFQAAALLDRRGIKNFYVDAGGDIQVRGSLEGKPWLVGVRSPWNRAENVKVLKLVHNEGVATSGTYIRGDHIWNPLTRAPAKELISLTVIGPDVYEADRFATAAFAMGREGISFIAGLPGLEGMAIAPDGRAVLTPGFPKYEAANA